MAPGGERGGCYQPALGAGVRAGAAHPARGRGGDVQRAGTGAARALSLGRHSPFHLNREIAMPDSAAAGNPLLKATDDRHRAAGADGGRLGISCRRWPSCSLCWAPGWAASPACSSGCSTRAPRAVRWPAAGGGFGGIGGLLGSAVSMAMGDVPGGHGRDRDRLHRGGRRHRRVRSASCSAARPPDDHVPLTFGRGMLCRSI